MRQLYERPEDLNREAAVMREVGRIWRDWSAVKMPLKYKLDFALIYNGAIGWFVEVRCRNVLSVDYPTFMFAAAKRSAALALTASTGLPCKMLIAYRDGLFILDFSESPDYAAIGGRNAVRDPDDIEPVVHYNVNRLTRVSRFNVYAAADSLITEQV